MEGARKTTSTRLTKPAKVVQGVKQTEKLPFARKKSTPGRKAVIDVRENKMERKKSVRLLDPDLAASSRTEETDRAAERDRSASADLSARFITKESDSDTQPVVVRMRRGGGGRTPKYPATAAKADDLSRSLSVSRRGFEEELPPEERTLQDQRRKSRNLKPLFFKTKVKKQPLRTTTKAKGKDDVIESGPIKSPSAGNLTASRTTSMVDDRPLRENVAALGNNFFLQPGRPRRIDHCAGLVRSKDPVNGDVRKHSIMTDEIWEDFEEYAATQYSCESVVFWKTGFQIVQCMKGPIPQAESAASQSEQGSVLALRAKLPEPDAKYQFEPEPDAKDAPAFINLRGALAQPLRDAIDAYVKQASDPAVRKDLRRVIKVCLVDLAAGHEVVGQHWNDFVNDSLT